MLVSKILYSYEQYACQVVMLPANTSHDLFACTNSVKMLPTCKTSSSTTTHMKGYMHQAFNTPGVNYSVTCLY